MNINITNDITVQLTLIPKGNKTDKRQYCIYLGFYIYEKGIKQNTHLISTGTTITKTEWKNGQMTGRNNKSKLVNERLNEYQHNAKEMLNELSLKRVKTCGELMREIKHNAKQRITGKAPRGLKNEYISKLKDYTYENVMKRLFDERNTCKGRKRGYNRSYQLLNEFFKFDMPTIDQITTEELSAYKKWFNPKKENTKTDYNSKIAAVFTYAFKQKILNTNPLPEKFRGSFVDANRVVLSETDCLKIMNLDDKTLSHTEQVAKYCLLVQLLTGMGYSDMKTLSNHNIIFDQNEQLHYIEKERNKTGVKFKIFLTDNAHFMVNKLRELTGSNTTPFDLPTIDYSLRIYKQIAGKAKIVTNITTYTLRHTFAVNYMENDGRIEDLSKILGHTLLKTTQIYGKISNKRLAEKSKQLQEKSKIHQLQLPKLIAV